MSFIENETEHSDPWISQIQMFCIRMVAENNTLSDFMSIRHLSCHDSFYD
jgi:hypothetical protein